MRLFDAPRDCTVTARVACLRERTLSPAFILVKDGLVEYIGGKAPEGIEPGLPSFSFDAVCEPLADAHVHLFLTGSNDPEERKAAGKLPREEALERIMGILEMLRRRGIASVRDGGDPHGLAVEAARLAKNTPSRYAQVAPSGQPLFRRGFYGGFLGAGVDSMDEAARLIRFNARAGAAQIKILATGLNSLDVPGRVGASQWSRSELAGLAEIAAGEGLRLMVHANGPCRDIIDVRPVSLEHGFWMAEEDLASLAGSGVVWTPTMAAWLGVLREKTLTSSQRFTVETTAARQRDAVAAASKLGCRLAAGSDAGTPGVPHDGGLEGELRLLAGAGLGAEGALRASISESALLCGASSGGLNSGGNFELVDLENIII